MSGTGEEGQARAVGVPPLQTDRIRAIADNVIASLDGLEHERAKFDQLSEDDQEAVLRVLAARGEVYKAWLGGGVMTNDAQAERSRLLLTELEGLPFEEREAAIAALPHDDRAAVLNAEAEADQEVLPEPEELGGEG